MINSTLINKKGDFIILENNDITISKIPKLLPLDYTIDLLIQIFPNIDFSNLELVMLETLFMKDNECDFYCDGCSKCKPDNYE